MKEDVCPRCRGSKTEGIMMDMGRIDLDEPCKKCHGSGKKDSKFRIKPTVKDDEIRKAFERETKFACLTCEESKTCNQVVKEGCIDLKSEYQIYSLGYKSRDKQIAELEERLKLAEEIIYAIKRTENYFMKDGYSEMIKNVNIYINSGKALLTIKGKESL